MTPYERGKADGIAAAWRAGFQAARECLSYDEAFCLTKDVEQDAWLDSETRALTPPDHAEEVTEETRKVLAVKLAGHFATRPWADMADDRAHLRRLVRDERYDINEPTRHDCYAAIDDILSVLAAKDAGGAG